MKQIHRAKRHRGPASGRQEPLAADPRDPDIVHSPPDHPPPPSWCRPGAVGSHHPGAPVPGRSRPWPAPWSC